MFSEKNVAQLKIMYNFASWKQLLIIGNNFKN